MFDDWSGPNCGFRRPVAEALARFIQQYLATEAILGHRSRSSWQPWDTTSQLIRLLEGVDVHILRRHD